MGGTICGMMKSTIYLPDEMDLKLSAEANATGISKAELIRRAIERLLDTSTRDRRSGPLPVFHSGRPRSPESMDDVIYTEIKERSQRR